VTSSGSTRQTHHYFHGRPGNLVKLYRFLPGGKKDTIPGEVIRYNRKDGTFVVEKAGVITRRGSTLAPARPSSYLRSARVSASRS